MVTAIVLLLVAAALIAAVGCLIAQKKAGKHSCGGQCSGCAYADSCKHNHS